MKNILLLICLIPIMFLNACKNQASHSVAIQDTVLVSDTIQYHPVRINKDDNSILPWFSSDQGASYDTVLMLVWDFWKNMETDSNGLKYYMNHQVWKPEHDMRGLGGDQINMALSSWALLYAYTGDQEVLDNMKYIADTYLERSLSSDADAWPYIPYPYNTVIHSGTYDGDMRNGKFITQPDKAGSLGFELITLYKITGDSKYLDAAKRVAGTIMKNMITGDSLRSPLPFRVNAKTGKPGILLDNNPDDFFKNSKKTGDALYTANWTGTLMMLEELAKLDPERRVQYEKSFTGLLDWMKTYPLKTNKWGPFFEDIPGWSDTQTNAITFAMFILQNPQLFTEWKQDVKSIIDWTYKELGNHEYEKYGVVVMNEQTVYRVPGNSHSSRQASVELMYALLSGDSSYTENAIRTLNWATYTVADDGRNRYIRDDIWLTDGYGDYVRHYLRAMYAMPELAPAGKNRLLGSTSVISSITYGRNEISYRSYDASSDEILRLKNKPGSVAVNGIKLNENETSGTYGWDWTPLDNGGVLKISKNGKDVRILF
ncbi:MAG TPA: hypothetical protein VHI78_03805 [Bacteroidales bacterium]|jgi:hypothetical protein|nr:hypothetical protein [Bacteroidales bacterium]